jgi:hypothetical protein
MSDKKPRVVVCAANKNRHTGQIVTGARHFDAVMRGMIGISRNDWTDSEQGFIDQFGVFMTREEAYEVAEAQGQVKYSIGYATRTLYSEHLY